MTVKITILVNVLLVLVVLTNGCSISKPSLLMEKMTKVERAISDAQDSKAQDLAPLELRYAQNNLQKAKEATQVKEYDKAIYLVDRALIDARLAQAKAACESARQDTKSMRDTLEALRKELVNKN